MVIDRPNGKTLRFVGHGQFLVTIGLSLSSKISAKANCPMEKLPVKLTMGHHFETTVVTGEHIEETEITVVQASMLYVEAGGDFLVSAADIGVSLPEGFWLGERRESTNS